VTRYNPFPKLAYWLVRHFASGQKAYGTAGLCFLYCTARPLQSAGGADAVGYSRWNNACRARNQCGPHTSTAKFLITRSSMYFLYFSCILQSFNLHMSLSSFLFPRSTHASPSAPSPPLLDTLWINSMSSNALTGVRRMGWISDAGEDKTFPVLLVGVDQSLRVCCGALYPPRLARGLLLLLLLFM
jgi:hypothetical protein